ncbi:MAG: hypothetical protein ACFB0Z_14970 [Candidatus Phaeomarinobacter sp.]|mgnify:CR=1 FL=1
MYNKMMSDDEKLSEEEARAARRRTLNYEASMAIEGIALHPADKVFADKIDAQKVGYEEGVRLALEHLKARGVVPPRDTDGTS